MKKTVLQVQPQRVNVGEYKAFGVDFEIMDYAFPSFKKAEITRAYEGTKVLSMHGPFIDINFASNDNEINRLCRRKILTAVKNGRELGVENVVLHSCFFPNLNNDALKDIYCDKAAEFLNKAVAETGMNFFIENTLDFFPDVLKMLIARADNPKINVCLDIGHANLSKADLTTWFKELSPYIGYMHVNGNDGMFDEHLPVGRGNIDWKLVKRLVDDYTDSPLITVEVAGIDNITSSIQYWRNLWLT